MKEPMTKEGNFPEISTLIDQHAARAYNFAYRLSGNEQDARDLVQQTFTKVLTHFGSYQRSRPFSPWFNRILKNVFLDGVRKVQSRRTMSYDGPSAVENVSWEQLLPGTDTTPLEQLEKLEMTERIRKAVNLLPIAYKTVLMMCDVERFSYRRISEILGCPVGTIRSRIHQARILLRSGFQKISAAN